MIILDILFVQELLIFSVFLLKILFNGLSLLKCLSINLRKYLPLLILESLQKGEVKIRLTFFPCLLFIIIRITIIVTIFKSIITTIIPTTVIALPLLLLLILQ